MSDNLKIYVYKVKELDANLKIYAFTKKQANELIEMYKRKARKNCEFLKISYSKKEIQQMNILVEKFGSQQVLVDKQYELLKR